MSKRPFIIDCDTGTDDAIAILAAYGCPDMDILAITSVNGNVSTYNVTDIRSEKDRTHIRPQDRSIVPYFFTPFLSVLL